MFITLVCLLSLFVIFPVAAQTESGLASFYDDAFKGRKTASGEQYDPTGFTAAHKTLRFGVRLEVTNPTNGKTVTVRVNDRGPVPEDRIIDLSRAAAEALEITEAGIAFVEIRALPADEQSTFTPTKSPPSYFQMGAFRTEANAQNLARSLVIQGHKPQIRQDSAMFRVYLTVEEVDAVALFEKLRKEGRNGFLQVSKEPSGKLIKLSTE